MAAIKVVVFGASGYTGAELLRILALHSEVEVVAVSADRRAGESLDHVHPGLGAIYPHLRLEKMEDIALDQADVLFCALPHGTTQEVVSAVAGQIRIIDLSADFRLRNVDEYAQWYGAQHKAVDLQKHAVYGLSEWCREDIKNTQLLANPGCYPTSVLMPLIPLIRQNILAPQHIVMDSKSGVSGAGRSLRDNLLFNEVNENFLAYGIGAHRHIPEIDQGLRMAGEGCSFSFTPHLLPIGRGILSTIHLQGSADEIRSCLKQSYEHEPFVQILQKGETAMTGAVRGTNNVRISVHEERQKDRAVIVSAIDNLVKGASGQAVQNMNIMFGFSETTALKLTPLRP